VKYVYLHGFASGPSSSKASYFQSFLRDRGVDLVVPELDEGCFEQLTITGQLKVVERVAGSGPVRLIGSSLGGWVAALYAAHHPEVDRLVLFAPAFGFPELLPGLLGPEKMLLWEREGSTEVMHYSSGRNRLLQYGIVQDASRFEHYPYITQPALIIHGTKDEAVPLSHSEHFAALYPSVRLLPVDSGHELTDVLELLGTETAAWFGLPR
jgi:pimeloyl-ACP methyl ester carboxylesterase